MSASQSRGSITAKLMRRIKTSANLSTVLRAVENAQIAPLHQYIEQLILDSGIPAADLFDQIALERTMGFRMLKGQRNPSRNVLLRMAIVLKLSTENTQLLLQSGGKAQLYPRLRRDAIILFAIAHDYSLPATEEMLLRMEETSLYVRI